MELWICRHPETYSNIYKILQGQKNSNLDKELTEKGYIQCKLLAKRLSKLNFDKIYVSDLKRTQLLAEEILNESENKSELILTKLVREKSGGILEGKSIELKRILSNKKNISHRMFRPIGGENNIDAFIRAKKFMYYIINHYVKANFTEKINESINKKTNFLHESYKFKIIKEINDNSNLNFDQREAEIERRLQEMEKIIDNEKFLMECNFEVENVLEEKEMEAEINKSESSQGDNDEINNISENILKSKTTNEIISTDYIEKEIDEFIQKINLTYLEDLKNKQYYGYNSNNEIKKVLLISHSGFISELLNVVRKTNNLKANEKNETSNTGIHMLRIYCIICGVNSVCNNKPECNAEKKKILEFDYLLTNDLSHLAILNDGNEKKKDDNNFVNENALENNAYEYDDI